MLRRFAWSLPLLFLACRPPATVSPLECAEATSHVASDSIVDPLTALTGSFVLVLTDTSRTPRRVSRGRLQLTRVAPRTGSDALLAGSYTLLTDRGVPFSARDPMGHDTIEVGRSAAGDLVFHVGCRSCEDATLHDWPILTMADSVVRGRWSAMADGLITMRPWPAGWFCARQLAARSP
jgi:hypothetical protein